MARISFLAQESQRLVRRVHDAADAAKANDAADAAEANGSASITEANDAADAAKANASADAAENDGSADTAEANSSTDIEEIEDQKQQATSPKNPPETEGNEKEWVIVEREMGHE